MTQGLQQLFGGSKFLKVTFPNGQRRLERISNIITITEIIDVEGVGSSLTVEEGQYYTDYIQESFDDILANPEKYIVTF